MQGSSVLFSFAAILVPWMMGMILHEVSHYLLLFFSLSALFALCQPPESACCRLSLSLLTFL